MKKYPLYFLIFFIYSCNNNTSTNSSKQIIEKSVNIGFVDIYTAAKNNNFLFYQLGIADIWLIENSGTLFNVKDLESTFSSNIDLTFSREKSKYFFRSIVPEGVYTGIILAFDYRYPITQILSIKDNKESTPYIFNAFGQELTNKNYIQKLTIHFPSEKKLTVKAGESTDLSLLFDVDASMRLMPFEDKIDGDQFLITPIIDAKQVIHYPGKVLYEGFLQEFDGTILQIIPHYSENWLQPNVSFSTQQNTTYNLNNEPTNLSTLIQKYSSGQGNNHRILIHCTGHYVDGNFIADNILFVETSENSNTLFYGFLYSNYFIGKATPLSQNNNHNPSGYYAQSITGNATDKTIRSFIGQVHAQANNKEAKIDRFKQLPTSTTGKVIAISQESIVLELANISGIDGKFLYNSETITVIPSDMLLDDIMIGDPIKATGIFTDEGVFQASHIQPVLNGELRYRLSLPLINTKPVIEVNDGELIILKNDGVNFLELSGEEISFPDNLYSIEKIDVKKAKFTILTERENPHSTINYYEKYDIFLSILQSRQQEGYRVNAIIADGSYQDNLFTATTLTLTLYAPTALDALDERLFSSNNFAENQPRLQGKEEVLKALSMLFTGAIYAGKGVYKQLKFVKYSLFFYINKKAFLRSNASSQNAIKGTDTIRRIRKKDMRKITASVASNTINYSDQYVKTTLNTNQTDDKYLATNLSADARKSYQQFLGIRNELQKEPFQLSPSAQKTLKNTLTKVKSDITTSSGEQADQNIRNAALAEIDKLLNIKTYEVTPRPKKR